MRFMCLIYFKDGAMDTLTPEEGRALTDATIESDHALRAKGQLVLAQPLQPPSHAVTLRQAAGKLTRTDGPFAETKEWLGGFYLIEAKSLEEAVSIASDDPLLQYGTLEIRPVLDQTHSQTGAGRPDLGP